MRLMHFHLVASLAALLFTAKLQADPAKAAPATQKPVAMTQSQLDGSGCFALNPATGALACLTVSSAVCADVDVGETTSLTLFDKMGKEKSSFSVAQQIDDEACRQKPKELAADRRKALAAMAAGGFVPVSSRCAPVAIGKPSPLGTATLTVTAACEAAWRGPADPNPIALGKVANGKCTDARAQLIDVGGDRNVLALYVDYTYDCEDMGGNETQCKGHGLTFKPVEFAGAGGTAFAFGTVNLARAKALIDKLADDIEKLIAKMEAAEVDQAKINQIAENFTKATEAMKADGEAIAKTLTEDEKEQVAAYGKAKIAPIMGKFAAAMAKAQRVPLGEVPAAKAAKAEDGLKRGTFEYAQLEALEFTQTQQNIQFKKSQIRSALIRTLEGELAAGTITDANKLADIHFRLAESWWEETHYMYLLDRVEYNKSMLAFDKRILKVAPTEPTENFAKSIGFYEKILQQVPAFGRMDEVLYRLGKGALSQGKQLGDKVLSNNGVRYLNQLVQKYQNSKYMAQTRLEQADHFFAMNNLTLAKMNYEQIVQNFRGASVYNFAMYKLGWVYYNLREFAHARELMRAVVAGAAEGQFATQAAADLAAFADEAGAGAE